MSLRYERINKNNLKIAAKIQYEIFPNETAYLDYIKEVEESPVLPIDFLVYYDDEPVGVIGLYGIKNYEDTVWLNWFGVVEKYRKNGFGFEMFKYIIEIAKKLNKKSLRLFTFEVWNPEAQKFYKKHMELEEYYTNQNDNQYYINVGKCKIFSLSLCEEKIDYWDNKFIDLVSEDDVHEKSLKLLKRDGII